MNLGFSIATLLRFYAKTLSSRLYISTLHASSLSFWLRMFCSCSSWWFDGENSNRLFRGYSHPFVMHCRFLFKPNTQRRRIDMNEICILIELFLFLLTPLPQTPRRIKVNGEDWLICITCVISIAFWLYKPSYGKKMSRIIIYWYKFTIIITIIYW